MRKWSPASNVKFINYVSVKIPVKRGQHLPSPRLIFSLFLVEAGPGLRNHCPRFAAEAEEIISKATISSFLLAFDRRFSFPRGSRTTEAKGTTQHLLGQQRPAVFLPLLLTYFLLLTLLSVAPRIPKYKLAAINSWKDVPSSCHPAVLSP